MNRVNVKLNVQMPLYIEKGIEEVFMHQQIHHQTGHSADPGADERNPTSYPTIKLSRNTGLGCKGQVQQLFGQEGELDYGK